MDIDLLSAPEYRNPDHSLNVFNIEKHRNSKNSGGGMACVMDAWIATLSTRYRVNVCNSVDQLSSKICLIEPIWFTSANHHNSYPPDEKVNQIKNHSAIKVLTAVEITPLRWIGRIREQILKSIDAFTVNCPYLWQTFNMVGMTPTAYLCDAIDENLFRPGIKEMSVIAVGALKHVKNAGMILDVFEGLQGCLKRIYMGSDQMWSAEQRKEDRVLSDKVQYCTDEYYPYASPVEVAYQLAHASFSINTTVHDCSSRSNEEKQMSGIVSIGGLHPLFEGRPGFHGLRSVPEFIDKIRELSNGFQDLPPTKLQEDARKWALKYVSQSAFLNQFEILLRNFI